ncbi:MAG: DUF2188 domain-containing protein [Tenericutes bacterium]|nr:DUF2188 domain-containing protein [Mycoplasmatota bacterium]
MFLNFIDQYGIFFGLLIGVILGLVFAYLLLSRPKRVTNHDNPSKEVELEKTKLNNQNTPLKTEASTKPVKLEKEDSLSNPNDLEADNLDITINKDKIIIDSFEEHNIEVETVQAIDFNEDIKPAEEKAIIQNVELQPKIVKDSKKAPQPKPEKKAPKAKPKVKKDLGRYHVLFRKEDSQWYVKREGSDRVVKVLLTQKEAIAFATIKSITQKTSIVIHKRDGKIRKQIY